MQQSNGDSCPYSVQSQQSEECLLHYGTLASGWPFKLIGSGPSWQTINGVDRGDILSAKR